MEADTWFLGLENPALTYGDLHLYSAIQAPFKSSNVELRGSVETLQLVY